MRKDRAPTVAISRNRLSLANCKCRGRRESLRYAHLANKCPIPHFLTPTKNRQKSTRIPKSIQKSPRPSRNQTMNQKELVHSNQSLSKNRSQSLERKRLQMISTRMFSGLRIKTKIAVLLKQIMVPLQEVTKFSALSKIDEMLQFLSQKVKQKLTTQQITEVNIQKQLSRQKNALNNYEAQIESFKKKLQDKQISQKTLKIKLKDTNNQLRELYDKLNIKQKELSAKVTELYQLKTTLKENQKILQSIQRKYDSLNEEAKVERSMFTDQSNDIIYSTKSILEENNKLLEKLKELEEQLQVTEQKQRALTEINTQLNLEVKRWRERFEDGSILQEEKQKRSLLDSINQKDFVEVLLVPSNELRKSTMSLHNQISSIDSSNRRVSLTALEIENLKLSSRVQDLERQNKQLNRDVVNYIAMKEHYEKTIAAVGQSNTSIKGEDPSKKIESLKETPIDLQQISQQAQNQKKLEQVAKEWKDKLYEIVNNYEDELQAIKIRVQQLTNDKQQLEKRLLEKTNQKYEVQKKLVEHEQQIYQLLKTYRNVNGLRLKQDRKEIKEPENQQQQQEGRGQTMSFSSDKQREKGQTD